MDSTSSDPAADPRTLMEQITTIHNAAAAETSLR